MPGNPRSSFPRYPPSRAFPINSSWRKWGSDRTAKFNIAVSEIRVGTEPANQPASQLRINRRLSSRIVRTHGCNEEEACCLRRLNNENNEGKKLEGRKGEIAENGMKVQRR